MLYLDYSANTPVDPRVLERFCQVENGFPGNANSHHQAGFAARREIDRAAASIAGILKAEPEELVFTSGASEANNLALKGIARTSRHIGKHIISTPLEHSSVSGCLTALQEQGYEIDLVDIRRDGTVDLEHLRELLRRDTVLVAVTAVDSELGVRQPLGKIRRLINDYPDCKLHVDATQAVGKIPVAFDVADTMSLTAHKFYGLNGIGLLVKRKGLALEPLIHGGQSTTIYRSGTPTTGLISSLALALELAAQEGQQRSRHVQALNQRLRRELSAFPGLCINSPAEAVAHILNISVPGMRGAEMQKALDERGICVSVKSACSSDALPSRAVFAVSRDRKRALSSWRISLSHLTSMEDIDLLLRALRDISEDIQAK